MKILVATPLWGDWGGRERYTADCIEEFARLGHSCSVVYGANSPRGPRTLPPAIAQYEMPTYSTFRSSSDSSEVQRLSRILETDKPDVVFMSDLKNFALLSLFRQYGHLVPMSHDNFLVCLRTTNITYVGKESCTHKLGYQCLLHGCFVRKHQSGPGFIYNSLAIHQALLRVYSNIGLHLVPSNYTKMRLVQHGFRPEHVKVVGSFTDVRPLLPAPASDDIPTVVFLGRVDRYKGLDYLLRALALVSAPFRCKVIGDGSYLHSCRRLAHTLGINRLIEFLGWLPKEEALRQICCASFVVVPSILPESLPLVVMEAMTCSRPVIAFDSGGISDALRDGETGYLVPVKNTSVLAQKIETLLRNPGRATRMGAEGHRVVTSMFSKQQHFKRLLCSFEEAARPGTSEQFSVRHAVEMMNPGPL
jgi:glycosyltransferase involved in cell wall biosynthesis